MRFLTAGDTAALIDCETLEQALSLFDRLAGAALPGVVDLIPAARTVLVVWAPELTDRATLEAQIRALPPADGSARHGQDHEIPVTYDGEDLAAVAEHLGWDTAQVIRRHTEALWTVAFTGFAPGFAYMTCDDPAFDLPRRPSPRVRIPAGSVALAGRFGGIYPSDSPGGWQLLGRTPVPMWDLTRPRPALLAPGDRVRFRDMGKGATISVPAASATPQPTGGIEVIRADLPAFWQDSGRAGQAGQGVGPSGTLDRSAARQANRLLGNDPAEPVLELTFGGLSLRADHPMTLALTGAPCAIRIAGRVDAPFGQPFALDAGETVEIQRPSAGIRSYLALRGGFAVTHVVDSSSYDTLAKVGPAPVITGSRLAAAHRPAGAVAAYAEPARALPRPGEVVTLDLRLGPRDDWFTAEGLRRLTAQDWRVTPQSSRIGLRLSGAEPLERRDRAELPSEATVTGALQVPHDGQPVLFLADHPLTGGYPVIGCVAAHHLDLAGQIPPGALIRFQLLESPAR